MKSQWFLDPSFGPFSFFFFFFVVVVVVVVGCLENPEGFWLLGAQACDLEFGNPKLPRATGGETSIHKGTLTIIGTFEKWQFWNWWFFFGKSMDEWIKSWSCVFRCGFKSIRVNTPDEIWEGFKCWAFWAWFYTCHESWLCYFSALKRLVFWSILETLHFLLGMVSFESWYHFWPGCARLWLKNSWAGGTYMISSIEGVQELLPGTVHHVFVEVPFWNSRPSMGYFA